MVQFLASVVNVAALVFPVFLKKSFVTVHIQDDEHFTDGAGVALVSPLILNVHLCQLE